MWSASCSDRNIYEFGVEVLKVKNEEMCEKSGVVSVRGVRDRKGNRACLNTLKTWVKVDDSSPSSLLTAPYRFHEAK